ncbi:RidA family protein [Listeria booriae]|uniref:RidA family protein n=1 Tax=Listeria booriae TaxID=1552123 RepID=A0A842G960_9LIST|nr:RidA family protein [Listeria booriae]MBC2293020.1 RidA family protein [Listeria booriae]
MKRSRNPQNIHPPLANYVHQIEINNPMKVLILSGQIGMNQEQVIPNDSVEQWEIALANIKANIEAANLEVADITKMTFYVVEPIESSIRGSILDNFFAGHKPCMTYLQIKALANPALKVEIDVEIYK